ncbi:MAG: enoyl-CoA hydratase/isomerase family protein, partial [Pseudomonadota bacterium]
IPEMLESLSPELSQEKPDALKQIIALLYPFINKDIPRRPGMDDWVRTYFAGRTSITHMVEDLRECSLFSDLCEGVFQQLSERSPTALAVTLQLLRRNKGRPIEDVFRADLKAARYLLDHPDYLEGIRARLIDRDDRPRWQPESLEEVGNIDLDLDSLLSKIDIL